MAVDLILIGNLNIIGNNAKKRNMPTIEYMSAMIGEDQARIMRNLKTTQLTVFEYEGYIFKGTSYAAKLEFVYNNPTGGDFFVWLQQNREIIKAS